MKRLTALAILGCMAMACGARAGQMTLISEGGSATVYGPLNGYAELDGVWGSGVDAVEAWKHPLWPLIPDSEAVWISNTEYIGDDDTSISDDSWRLFEIPISLPENAGNIVGTAQVTSDNAEEVYVNGNLVGSDGEVQGAFLDNQEWNTILPYNLTGLQAGENTVSIIVRNYAGSSDREANPTGLLYQMDITWCLWIGETAWAAGNRYVAKGNWATYVQYDDEGLTVDLLAGQTMEAGTVAFSAAAGGEVTITITLNDGWRFKDVDENVKIQDYADAPSGNPAPGKFDHKFDADSAEGTWEGTVPENNFYGVHVEVEWLDCGEDTGQ